MPRDMKDVLSPDVEHQIVNQLESEICAVLVQVFYNLFLHLMVAPRPLFDNKWVGFFLYVFECTISM